MIDINTMNVQKLKLADLIEDAVDRKDTEAIAWLKDQAMKKVDRKGKQVFQPVNMFRIEYLTKFCGYEKKKAVKLTPEEKREKMLNSMFDKAMSKMEVE